MRTIQREITGPVIISSDSQILLCKSHQGGPYADYWVIPGGGVEQGETKLDAVIRETREEIGIDISRFNIHPINIVLTDSREKIIRQTGEKVYVHMTFYSFMVHADKPAHALIATPADDIVEATWFPLTDLPRLRIPPVTKKTFHAAGLL